MSKNEGNQFWHQMFPKFINISAKR